MKKFLLGILFTLIASTLTSYTYLNGPDKGKLYDFVRFMKWDIFSGMYILNPLEGKCKDEMGENGFGWKFNIADYYRCDRFQRLFNWNFKPRNYNSSTF